MNHAIEILTLYVSYHLIKDIDGYMGQVCDRDYMTIIVWRNFDGVMSRPYGDAREFQFAKLQNPEYRYVNYCENGIWPEDNPGIVELYADGTLSVERWIKKGLHHRKNGPAFKAYNPGGRIYLQSWLQCGSFHNSTGPAQIGYYDNGKIHWESYWEKGHHHRTNGAAYIEYDHQGVVKCQLWVESNKIIKRYGMEHFSAPNEYCWGLSNVGLQLP